jgi:hypothetical protein
MLRSKITVSASSKIVPRHRGVALPLTSVNSATSVLRTASKAPTPLQCARRSPLRCPPRRQSNAHKPIPFIGLLRDSLDAPGVGVPARHSSLVHPEGRRAATFPFRIISLAHPHPLTPIESHSYKKQGGGVSFRFDRGRLQSVLFRQNAALGI